MIEALASSPEQAGAPLSNIYEASKEELRPRELLFAIDNTQPCFGIAISTSFLHAGEMVQLVDCTLSEWEEKGYAGPSERTIVTYLTAIARWVQHDLLHRIKSCWPFVRI